MKQTAHHRFPFVLRLLALCATGLAISLPFVWMVSASFKTRAEVDQVQIVPHHATVRNYPMSVGMLSLDSSYGRQTELIMAATVMNVVPLVVIFAVFQKFLVGGLQLGGVKG